MQGAPGGVKGDSVQEVREAAHYVQVGVGQRGRRGGGGGGGGAEEEDAGGGGNPGPGATASSHRAPARQCHVGADRADVRAPRCHRAQGEADCGRREGGAGQQEETEEKETAEAGVEAEEGGEKGSEDGEKDGEGEKETEE